MSRLRLRRRSERLMQLFVVACGLFALTRCSVETRHKLPIRALEGIAPQFDLKSPILHREESLDLNCANSPSSRGCWGAGFDINTDVDGAWPDTGRIAEYTLTIRNTTCDPDRHGSRQCLLVNDQYPGPTLHAEWGDTFQITIVYQMQDNETSVHWHGIRQLNSNHMDGTSGITECPLAPGQSRLYAFRATQHGTFWYHSHYSAQYSDGVMGAIVIHGPASASYDEDLGALILNDWYWETIWRLTVRTRDRLQNLPSGDLPGSGPGFSDNILVNGTNKNSVGDGGNYHVTRIESGKTYRVRLINVSTDNALRVSLDGHTLQVITADSVPIRPFTADSLMLNVGQRYDVIIHANQTAEKYWFRADVETACAAFSNSAGRSIFQYTTVEAGTPADKTTNFTSSCDDASPLIPLWPMSVPRENFDSQAQILPVDVYAPGLTTNNQSIYVWGVNMTAIDVDWEMPVISNLQSGNSSYPSERNVLTVPSEQRVYWIIQETAGSIVPIGHPIHLHGHYFYVLGAGPGQWSRDSDLNFDNPPRRDSATLPGFGWLVIAFRVDNPGAWLMHCHVSWHISQGLGAIFLEDIDHIPAAMTELVEGCQQWKEYEEYAAYRKDDSGL